MFFPFPICFFFFGRVVGGLRGRYHYNTQYNDLPRLPRTQYDSTIDFDYKLGKIGPAVTNAVSVRWEGLVLPEYSEVHTFSLTIGDDEDGTLWIDGTPIIERSRDFVDVPDASGLRTTLQATVALSANSPTHVRLDYVEREGYAIAKMQWESPSMRRQPITSSRLLYPFAETDFQFTVLPSKLLEKEKRTARCGQKQDCVTFFFPNILREERKEKVATKTLNNRPY